MTPPDRLKPLALSGFLALVYSSAVSFLLGCYKLLLSEGSIWQMFTANILSHVNKEEALQKYALCQSATSKTFIAMCKLLSYTC